MKTRLLFVLILITALFSATVSAQADGKTIIAPGWSIMPAAGAFGCESVLISGTVQPGILAVEVQDASTYSFIYANEVPGNWFVGGQILSLPAPCANTINVYVFPVATPYRNWLVFDAGLSLGTSSFHHHHKKSFGS